VTGGGSLADELGKLADLRERGVLTDDELAERKTALLGSSQPGPSNAPTHDQRYPEGAVVTPAKPRRRGALTLVVIAALILAATAGGALLALSSWRQPTHPARTTVSKRDVESQQLLADSCTHAKGLCGGGPSLVRRGQSVCSLLGTSHSVGDTLTDVGAAGEAQGYSENEMDTIIGVAVVDLCPQHEAEVKAWANTTAASGKGATATIPAPAPTPAPAGQSGSASALTPGASPGSAVEPTVPAVGPDQPAGSQTIPTDPVVSSTTPTTPPTTLPPQAEAAGCTEDGPMVQPSSLSASCNDGPGHESNGKGDSVIWEISWSSWNAQAAAGTGTYYTGTGQGPNGQDGPQWGVDIRLSSPQWTDNGYLFTTMTLTCDPSVPPPTSAPDTPSDCSDMTFTLPMAS
jgi:hypothetical protein